MLAGGELRQGALAGIVTDAVAAAAGVEAAAVRRAAMLAGDLPAVAEAALTQGAAGLGAFHLQVGRPVQPMLAKTAPSLEAALQQVAPAAVEWKLDGVRIQVHRDGDDVAVFTRTLDPVGERMPEIVEAVRALPLRSVILDGEAIALRPDGRPRPFQETASRAASRGDVAALRQAVPLTPFLFDALHLDGRDLLDLPAHERLAAIEPVLPAGAWVPRLVTGDLAAAQAFLDDALARGHEGVVVKSQDAPYEAGRRGAGWLKVKPVHTLDLVVLAAEWGHGRRQGWLSNLHLGARDPESNGWVMLGKTFKGLTDELLEWQTARLLELESHRDASTVYVHPQLVVEIAFDGIQTSPRYPGGVALRFARVVRYRDDKRADEADTIETVRMLHAARSAEAAISAGRHEQDACHRQHGSRLLHARHALAQMDARERDRHDRKQRAEHGRDREQLQRGRDGVGEVREHVEHADARDHGQAPAVDARHEAAHEDEGADRRQRDRAQHQRRPVGVDRRGTREEHEQRAEQQRRQHAEADAAAAARMAVAVGPGDEHDARERGERGPRTGAATAARRAPGHRPPGCRRSTRARAPRSRPARRRARGRRSRCRPRP